MGRTTLFKTPHPPIASSSRSPKPKPKSNMSPDIITFRWNDKMVYVPPPASHQEAVDQAKEEFAEELAGFDDQQFCFTVAVTIGEEKEKQTVNISQRAWETLMPRLKQYEIVNISIRPLVVVHPSEDAPPPQYAFGDEKDGQSLSRQPSPARLDTSSASGSRSQTSSRPGSPNMRSRAMGWIERRIGNNNDA
ncbi:hypothetical protein QCA50_005079 [Cerrena zonata]|uniref:Uncharacterized protein n=1 Tax=Cerrena zonata TaxID=2478898 RepID=A0AAW0GEG5_9APHY